MIALALLPLPLAGEGWGEGGPHVVATSGTTLIRPSSRTFSRQREREALIRVLICWWWIRRWQNWMAALGWCSVLVGIRLWPHEPLSKLAGTSTAVYDDSGHLLRLTLASR